MNKKEIINSADAPEAIGAYSQGIILDNIIFTSGQIPLCPLNNKVISNSFDKQVIQVLANIESVLLAANSNKNKIIKLTVYLTDLDDFDELNKIFKLFFKDSSYPARSVVEVSKLPKNVKIEIDVVAYK